MTIGDLARLWSEEAGQSASKIQQDLEIWLATRQSGSVKGEAQAAEEKSVSDDLLTLLTGDRYIERDACEAYCRERGLNLPEFWFSDTGPPTEAFSAESERSDDEAVRCAGLLTLLCGAETKSSLQPEMPEPLAVPPEEKKSETVVSLISENSSYITQELESPFTPVVDRARGVLEILLLPLARRPLTTAVAAATVLSIAVVGSQQWLEVGNDEFVEARLLEHAQERTPDKNPIMGLSGAQGIDQERVEATLGAVQLPNSQIGSSPAPALERATTVSTLEADTTPIPSSKGTVLRSFSEKPDGLRSVGPEEVTNDAVEPVIVESMSPGRIDPERTDRETVTAYQFSPRPQSSARRNAAASMPETGSTRVPLPGISSLGPETARHDLAESGRTPRKSLSTERLERFDAKKEAPVLSAANYRESSTEIEAVERADTRIDEAVPSPSKTDVQSKKRPTWRPSGEEVAVISSFADRKAPEATITASLPSQSTDSEGDKSLGPIEPDSFGVVEPGVSVPAPAAADDHRLENTTRARQNEFAKLPSASPEAAIGVQERIEVVAPRTSPRAKQLVAIRDEVLVYLIHRELNARNLYAGRLAGEIGPDLTAAIRAYQRTRGLRPDGKASRDLLLRLVREDLGRVREKGGVTEASLESTVPSGKKLTRQTQALLKAAGFDPGPVDGIAGSRTESAIRSYQRAHGLNVNGYVTPDLFVHLEATTYERQAQRQFARGNYEQAAESFTWLIMMRPGDANAYFNRGLTYSSAGFPSRAIDDFSIAVHLDPMHVKAQFGLGEARYQTGMYQEALSAYSRAAWAWIVTL